MATETDAIIDAFSADSDPGLNDLTDLIGAVKLKPITDPNFNGYVSGLSSNARAARLTGLDGTALEITSDKDVIRVITIPLKGTLKIRLFRLA